MHSRVTLKLKVTSWFTWPVLSLHVFVLPRWFFCCFIKILGQEIHSNYRRLRGLHAWTWNRKSRHVAYAYVTYVISACICTCFVRLLGQGIHSNYCHSRDRLLRKTLKLRITSWSTWRTFVIFSTRMNHCVLPQWFFVLSSFQVKEFILTIATCVTTCVTIVWRKVPSWSTCFKKPLTA